MKYTFDAVVVGNAGIDTNVYFPHGDIDFSVESNFTENRDYVGQAGGYSARGFARLGYRTAFIGCIGDDYCGRFIREEFNRDKINMDGMFIDPAGSSRSINFMYPDGRRKNFYDGKSHLALQPDLSRCESILKKTKVVHFNIPHWARQLLPLVDKHRTKISCDIQDVVSTDDNYREDFIDYADILFFSAVNHQDPGRMIKKLLQKFPEKIIISGMGERGCALGAGKKVQFFQPAPGDLPVIDTNGAGDALAVGFLSAYIFEKWDLIKSVLSGQIAARYTCTQKASSSNLITLDQLHKTAAGLSQ